MKQFYVKEYLKNPERKVVTRDGSPVRIICIDRAGMNTKPIVALLLLPNGDEVIKSYWEDGIETAGSEGGNDLFFAPTKHTGWVNIYYRSQAMICGLVYKSKERAQQEIDKAKLYITTTKIEWED